jgi:hypothetical protein
VLPVKMNIGIHAGLSYNSINFGNSTKSDYSPGSNMGMRLTLENAFTWEENISFSADFTLQWFSNYHLYKVREFSSQITYNDVEYDLVPEGSIYGVTSVDVNIETLSLKIPFCVNYHFSKARLRPKVGIGFINMLVISQNTDFVYHDFYYEFNRSIPVYHFGFRGKIGLDYQLKNEHSIYFDLNYDYTQSANINAILRFRNNLFAFNLGYTL